VRHVSSADQDARYFSGRPDGCTCPPGKTCWSRPP